jgi:hypothetical protein
MFQGLTGTKDARTAPNQAQALLCVYLLAVRDTNARQGTRILLSALSSSDMITGFQPNFILNHIGQNNSNLHYAKIGLHTK